MPEGNFFTDFNDILRGRAESRRGRVVPIGGELYPTLTRGPPRPGAASTAPRAHKTISDYFGVIRRRWWLAAGATALLTAIAGVVTWETPTRYRAEAVVLLDTRDLQVQDLNAAIPARLFDATKLHGEMEVLKSRSLAERVVQKLHLAERPDFAGPAAPAQANAARRLQRAVDTLLSQLAVENDGRSLVLRIEISAANPQLAAEIANAYAELYLEHQVAVKEQATQRASEWLKKQIAALRDQLAVTEERIGQYKAAHGITSTHGATVSAQELADINAQLIAAHSDRVQKEAAYRYAKQVLVSPDGAASAGQVLASPLIQRLREQEADLLRQMAELSTRYRPAHPTMIRMKAEYDDLRRKIAAEANRIVQSMADQANAARTREEALKTNLAELAQSTARQQNVEVELQELEHEAEASRALYQNLLTRFQQTSAQEDIQLPDAQIVSKADPSASRSWPNRPRQFAVAALFSLILAVALPFVVELLDSSFRRADDIEEALGLPALGVLPAVELARGSSRPAERAEATLSEALRSIRSGLRQVQNGAPTGVLLVTSSTEGEGKTFFAAALGRSIVRARLRCLLVDCNFQRPGIDKLMSPTPSESMPTPATYPQIQIDRHSGLHYIPAPAVEQRRLFRSQDLFESAEMRSYIQRMRGHYDLIILDAPPAAAVADVVALSHLADIAVFLVRWGRTPRRQALSALHLLAGRGLRLAGLVLSRVDLRRYATYGYADYVRYLESALAPARGR
jgi:polysaccharide biosynthesis transport protein